MYKDETFLEHLHQNPRSIKRIFNVVSVTASVIESLQKRVSFLLSAATNIITVFLAALI